MTVRTLFTIGSILLLWAGTVQAGPDPTFQRWLTKFRVQAQQEGVQPQILDRAFAGVTEPDAEVLRKASYQPEFTQEIWDYLDARINPAIIEQGQAMAEEYRHCLAAIEARFGVRREVILAIWSMETGFGRALERRERLHYVPLALATLAYADPKRARFGRNQLVAALKILQAGDVEVAGFLGSWAGAMGHTQFIPTSYLAYAVDMDGNGQRDIWHSVDDALATAANLLQENGWRTGRTWGYEVVPIAGLADMEGQTKTLEMWTRAGVHRPLGKSFPRPEERAELLLPAGPDGPAFLMLRNFFVIKRYNNANSYALAVGLLADRLAGTQGLTHPWPRPAGSLSGQEKFELQRRLKQRGLYSGAIDGDLGAGTHKAIRHFQAQQGLSGTGQPSREILEALRRQ